MIIMYSLIARPASKLKVALAKKLEQLFGPDSICDPADLITNRGSNSLNDLCSWCGHLQKNGSRIDVCSWTTMTELVKNESELVIIDKDTGEVA